MTNNRIRPKIEETGRTQAEVAKMLPDEVGSVGMYLIVNGSVLPTKQSLKTLCDIFGCSPLDLYEREDLRLDTVGQNPAVVLPKKTVRQHKGMTELRVWLRPYEKESLVKSVADLGYRNVSEWLREMIRNTIARNKRLQNKTETA